MAIGGGRQIGLFNELTAFFSSMNMYSAQKKQPSDTPQYQDFLKMHNGNSKTRETSKSIQYHCCKMNLTKPLLKINYNDTKIEIIKLIEFKQKSIFDLTKK